VASARAVEPGAKIALFIGMQGIFRVALVSPSWMQISCIQNKSGQGDRMKPSTKDNLEGKMHQVKGAVKEGAGKLVNNPDLEAEGQIEKLHGKVQEKIGEIEKVAEK
jgi:uncharacterized protein YjbJ (UPF0337 family)